MVDGPTVRKNGEGEDSSRILVSLLLKLVVQHQLSVKHSSMTEY